MSHVLICLNCGEVVNELGPARLREANCDAQLREGPTARYKRQWHDVESRSFLDLKLELENGWNIINKNRLARDGTVSIGTVAVDKGSTTTIHRDRGHSLFQCARRGLLARACDLETPP